MTVRLIFRNCGKNRIAVIIAAASLAPNPQSGSGDHQALLDGLAKKISGKVVVGVAGEIRSNQERWTLIGSFFTRTAHRLFGGELNRKQHSRKESTADVILWDLGAQIEVKAFSSRDFPKIFSDQFDNYKNQLGFPVDECWYAFFSYRNRGRRVSAETPNRNALRRFLAKNTDLLVVMDIAVLDALIRRSPTIGIWRHDRTYPVAKISRRTFDRLVKNPAAFLENLGVAGGVAHERLDITGSAKEGALALKALFILPENSIKELRRRAERKFIVKDPEKI